MTVNGNDLRNRHETTIAGPERVPYITIEASAPMSPQALDRATTLLMAHGITPTRVRQIDLIDQAYMLVTEYVLTNNGKKKISLTEEDRETYPDTPTGEVVLEPPYAVRLRYPVTELMQALVEPYNG